MSNQPQSIARRSCWWAPPAATAAVAAGLAAALQLMWGNFAAGGGLLAVSVALLYWPVSVWNADLDAGLPPRPRRLALLAVCATGVIFRTYQLDPPGLWGDDAINALLAFDILDGRVSSPFQLVNHAHSRFHALSNYPIAAAFWAFGADLPTLRLPGVLAGILAVPLLYGTIAPLFGARVALIAAFFFAVSPLQISHAKILVQVISGQFLQLLGLCLLVRGVTGKRHWLAVAAAVPLAGCVYTYHAAKLAPLVAVPYLLAAYRESRPPRHRALAYGIAALAVFALCLVPAVLSYAGEPGALSGRVGETSILRLLRKGSGLAPLWDSFWRTAMIFHYEQGPVLYHWFGPGRDPALDVVIGFLFVHGLVASVPRWRQARYLLLFTWAFVGLVPGVLSTGAPRVYRVLLATPPLYVWAALPLAALLAYQNPPATARRWLRSLAAVLILSVPFIDFNYYFYRVYTHPHFHWFQSERMIQMARALRSYGPGWVGYVLSPNFTSGHETLRFLSRAWGLQMRDVKTLTGLLPVGDPPPGGVLFMISDDAVGAAAVVEDVYPTSRRQSYYQPEPRTWWFGGAWPFDEARRKDRPTVTFVAVSHDQAEARRGVASAPRGLLAEYDLGGRQLQRVEPFPFYWFFPDTFQRPFSVRWSGALRVPPPGGYRLSAQANGKWKMLVDGHSIDSSSELAVGLHAFEMRIENVPRRARLRLWWQGPEQMREMIPPEAWRPPIDAP